MRDHTSVDLRPASGSAKGRCAAGIRSEPKRRAGFEFPRGGGLRQKPSGRDDSRATAVLPDDPAARLSRSGSHQPARHHVHRLHQSAPEPRRGHAGLGDPLDRPVIDPNYLSHSDEVAPGAHLRSDADLESFVRRTASTTWHPAGTCEMGHDAMASSIPA
ncbi:hypothetical protein EVC37_18595 [Methylocaldum sp. BRCS4]|nr:hypothetical protein [Methylocaldum sp. BRCS4]